MFPASTKGGGASLAFPDVCKVPAPPAPFVPIPYPNSQLQENLKSANKADAKAKSGDKAAKMEQGKAIRNLKKQTGMHASSATQAVLLGRTIHVKFVGTRSSASVPSGLRISPSQTKVRVSP